MSLCWGSCTAGGEPGASVGVAAGFVARDGFDFPRSASRMACHDSLFAEHRKLGSLQKGAGHLAKPTDTPKQRHWALR